MVEIYHSIFDTGNCKASILDTVNFAAESKVAWLVLQLISNTVQCTVTSTNITYLFQCGHFSAQKWIEDHKTVTTSAL